MENYKEHDFLTATEVADILRMSKSKCYDLINSPDCPFNVVPLGRLKRIPANNFWKWYDSLSVKEINSRKRGK